MPSSETSKKGLFIMIDGIDGSGKSTILDVWKKNLIKNGLSIFDLREWWKKHKTFPQFGEIKDVRVIISAEPTSAWIGQAIREEIIRDGLDYEGKTAAQAFALDREVLYRRLLIPAFKAGKIILQERGVSTSLAYQPIQKKRVSLKYVLGLAGNKLALIHPPNFLVIVHLPPKLAIARLKKRFNKKDGSIFENLAFEIKAQKRFLSSWFQKIFEKMGTYVLYLETAGNKQKVQKEALKLLQKLLKKLK